ncbi:MAG: Hsp20/alpha crystallin family protein [Promethearchaeota archaeon]
MNEKKSKTKERRTGRKKIFPPIICTSNDENDNKYIIDVTLPGVKKENISLRLNEDRLYIEGESSKYKYLGGTEFCCQINPEKAGFTYSDGSVKIYAPFKEIEIDTSKIEA